MNIIYRKTMLEKIMRAKHAAEMQRKQIEKIELSVDEADVLNDELWRPYLTTAGWSFRNWLYSFRAGYPIGPQPVLTVCGIRIEVSR